MDYSTLFPEEVKLPGRWPTHLGRFVDSQTPSAGTGLHAVSSDGSNKNHLERHQTMEQAGSLHTLRRDQIEDYQNQAVQYRLQSTEDAERFKKKLDFLKEESRHRRSATRRKKAQPGYWRKKKAAAKEKKYGKKE